MHPRDAIDLHARLLETLDREREVREDFNAVHLLQDVGRDALRVIQELQSDEELWDALRAEAREPLTLDQADSLQQFAGVGLPWLLEELGYKEPPPAQSLVDEAFAALEVALRTHDPARQEKKVANARAALAFIAIRLGRVIEEQESPADVASQRRLLRRLVDRTDDLAVAAIPAIVSSATVQGLQAALPVPIPEPVQEVIKSGVRFAATAGVTALWGELAQEVEPADPDTSPVFFGPHDRATWRFAQLGAGLGRIRADAELLNLGTASSGLTRRVEDAERDVCALRNLIREQGWNDPQSERALDELVVHLQALRRIASESEDREKPGVHARSAVDALRALHGRVEDRLDSSNDEP